MNRNIKLDFLRSLAIFGVIGNHLFYPIYGRSDFFGGNSWWLALFIYTLSLTSVPLFIIISGYLLIDKQETHKKTFDRLVKKLLIPLVFWFSLFLIWKVEFRSVKYSLSEIFHIILSGDLYYFYFLIILMGLYLLLPFFRLVAKSGDTFLKKGLLVGAFSIGIVIYGADYLINKGGSSLNLVTWWLPYVGYFWFGYMIKQSKQVWSVYSSGGLFLSWFVVTIMLGFISIFLSSLGYSFAFKNGVYYWHTFLSINVILMSIGLFLFILKSNWMEKVLSNRHVALMIQRLGILSYGMYLLHAFVIDWVDIKWGYAIEFVSDDLISFTLVRPVLVFGLTLLLSIFVSYTPLLRRSVGNGR